MRFNFRSKNIRRIKNKRTRRSKRSKRIMSSMARKENVGRQLYYFKRFGNDFSLAGQANNPLYTPYISTQLFRFNQIVNHTDFVNLFDQYRITHCQVIVWFKYAGAFNGVLPRFYWYADYDDTILPSDLNEFRQHSKCKVAQLNLNRPIVINIKPAVLVESYRSPVSTGYLPKWRQLIDMSAPDVPHYGLKWAIDKFDDPVASIHMETRYWFQCRQPS